MVTDYELKVKILPSSHEQTQKAANFSSLVKRYDCVCVCARAIRGERQSKDGSLGTGWGLQKKLAPEGPSVTFRVDPWMKFQ